ncbi:hypothetical protein ACKWTF_006200 [Chironomus riparius]
MTFKRNHTKTSNFLENLNISLVVSLQNGKKEVVLATNLLTLISSEFVIIYLIDSHLNSLRCLPHSSRVDSMIRTKSQPLSNKRHGTTIWNPLGNGLEMASKWDKSPFVLRNFFILLEFL